MFPLAVTVAVAGLLVTPMEGDWAAVTKALAVPVTVAPDGAWPVAVAVSAIVPASTPA